MNKTNPQHAIFALLIQSTIGFALATGGPVLLPLYRFS